ncbi:hypothetical protein JCM10212_001927 [Sporobolomyces blumeae]
MSASSASTLKAGRRPPFHPFGDERDDNLDSCDLADIELCNFADIEKFDRLVPNDADRAWNTERERILTWIYDPASPCLVDPTYPDQHQAHLSEAAFADRTRRLAHIEEFAGRAGVVLHDPQRLNEVSAAWSAMSIGAREDLLVKHLAAMQRFEPMENVCGGLDKGLNLIPELNVAKLCAEDGRGFLDFIDLVKRSTAIVVDLEVEPLYNEVFFRKMGIASDSQSPKLSKADRAFQMDVCWRRHLTLFCFLDTFFQRLDGFDPFDLAPGASEVIYGDYESCNSCGKTGEVGRKRLLCCAKCQAVGRFEAYCSTDCQKDDWREHRSEGRCGVPASLLEEIDEIWAPDRPPTPAEYLRARVLRMVLLAPNYFWTTPIPGISAAYDALIHEEDDVARQARVNSDMRDLAFRALEDNDRSAVNLLAYAVFKYRFVKVWERIRSSFCQSRLDKVFEWLRASLSLNANGGEASRASASAEHALMLERETSFRNMFDLGGKQAWHDALARGKLEFVKAENESVRRYFKVKQQRYLEALRSAILSRYQVEPPRLEIIMVHAKAMLEE